MDFDVLPTIILVLGWTGLVSWLSYCKGYNDCVAEDEDEDDVTFEADEET